MTAPRLAALVTMVAGLLVGACVGAPSGGHLPGPVPEGVSFHEAPAGAPPAPAISLELLDGQVLDVAGQWAERPVVLVFFESWCSLCREQQPGLNEVAADYRDVVLFLGIASQSAPAEVELYVSETGIAYPVGVDPSGRVALQYAVAEPPLVALISKDGRLLRGWPEGIAGAELREHIDRLAVRSR